MENGWGMVEELVFPGLLLRSLMGNFQMHSAPGHERTHMVAFTSKFSEFVRRLSKSLHIDRCVVRWKVAGTDARGTSVLLRPHVLWPVRTCPRVVRTCLQVPQRPHGPVQGLVVLTLCSALFKFAFQRRFFDFRGRCPGNERRRLGRYLSVRFRHQCDVPRARILYQERRQPGLCAIVQLHPQYRPCEVERVARLLCAHVHAPFEVRPQMLMRRGPSFFRPGNTPWEQEAGGTGAARREE
ncbi:hypothetical protein GGX14DRAFT_465330 [Mycena pura]|uniref:Uncharacterized protein n=1 Tax=Mycena pura TaxID=153505 RepID=A0AAD6V5J3_9AGAR|nr:hypothetical protein GGX14DRAFT_465330 [Mycena pura]